MCHLQNNNRCQRHVQECELINILGISSVIYFECTHLKVEKRHVCVCVCCWSVRWFVGKT
jgi:hypothetical protein